MYVHIAADPESDLTESRSVDWDGEACRSEPTTSEALMLFMEPLGKHDLFNVSLQK